MINNLKSNRKYILFLILNILLIYTIYFYLVANNKNKIIDDLKYQVEKIGSENKDLELKKRSLLNIEDSIDEKDETYNLSFIKDKFYLSIEDLFDENGLKIIEYRLINTERIDSDDFIYFKKELYYNFISDLSNLDNLIDGLDKERIVIKDLKLDRVSVEDFGVDLIIEEYSLESISHSGVKFKNVKDENFTNIEAVNLLEENFGVEEKENKNNYINKTINSSKKEEISGKDQKIDKEDIKALDNEVTEFKKTNETIDYYIEVAEHLDEKGKMNNDEYTTQVINKSYFEENYSVFSKNLELLNHFSYDSELEEWIIKVENELDLDEAPIILSDCKGNYYLKAFSDKDSIIKVFLKTANETDIDIEIKCKAEELNLYQFNLPDLKELMPITIYRIVTTNSEGDVNVQISNLVYIEK